MSALFFPVFFYYLLFRNVLLEIENPRFIEVIRFGIFFFLISKAPRSCEKRQNNFPGLKHRCTAELSETVFRHQPRI